MPPSGVKTTDIIPRPVLYLLIPTNNARTDSLIIKVVRKTDRGLAVNRAMSTPVLRDGFMLLPTAVLMILLTVNAARLLLLPDVRPITALTVPVRPPVPMPAAIPVTVVVMTTVRPERLKTIPVPYLLILNAVRPVSVAKTVLPAAHLIPALMSDLQNAGLVTLVPTPAGRVLNPSLVLRPRIRLKFQQPSAEPLVILVKLIRIVP